MKTHNKIFKENFIIDKINKELDISDEEIKVKKEILKNWIEDINSKIIYNYNEEQLQEKFVNIIFRDLLGYDDRHTNREKWNLELEMRTDLDGQKPDATFGYFNIEDNKVCAVLELKDPKYRDLDKKQNRKQDNRTPVEQAFNYTHKYKNGTCRWVLVSNFNEIRLYSSNNSTEYENFFIEKLTDDAELKRFIYLLSKNHILEEKLTELIDLNIKEEQQIEKDFYNKYKKIRFEVIQEIINNNRNISKDIIISKSQKLLDRFLFIAFCEDKNFIAPNTFYNRIINATEYSDKQEQFTLLCSHINKGNPKQNINKFNGGLFKEDETLDTLIIPDNVFDKLLEIAAYDFNTDVDENILGHIFEQSLNDLEELKAEYSGEKFDTKKSKRKKDGVFYTPKHITRKIVETAIKEYIENKRNALGIEPSDLRPNLKIDYLRKLRKEIMSIKIIDPACGSGAFLITAFDTLKNEMNKINNQINDLKGSQLEIFDGDDLYSSYDDNDILKNCLYGVDLNKESVEITRLSLWLRTLSSDKPLTNLDNNIKCGNSLIDDSEIAGEFAFNWKKEFPQIFEKGGFDIVIGNPPYVRHENIKEIKPALEKSFKTYTGTADLYCYFYELGLSLIKPGGVLGFITSNKWLKIAYGKNIRNFLNEYFIVEIDDYQSIKLFDAGVETNILILKKIKVKNEKVKIYLAEDDKSFETNQNNFDDNAFLFLDNKLLNIKEKIDKLGTPLKEWDININYGIKTGLNEAFIIDEEKYKELINKDRKNKDIIVPLLRGQDIKRYDINYKNLYLINTHNGYKDNNPIDIEDYPMIKEHLLKFEPKLSNRYDKGSTPFNLRNCAYIDEFKKEKIVYGQINNSAKFTILKKEFLLNDTAFMINGNKIKYILAMLNSKLLWTSLVKFYSGIVLSSGIKLGKNSLIELPIIKPTIEQEEDLTKLTDKIITEKENLKKYNQIINLAVENKDYEKQLEYKNLITKSEEEILDAEYKIDEYIFAMYQLTNEEIELIKNS